MTPISKSLLITVCSILIMGLAGCEENQQNDPQQSAQSGLLIQNATIVDGTGAEPYQGDIRVVGERIVNIGDALEPLEGDQLIDAKGLVVAPGFIDMHAHVSNIHEYPQAENFLRQGVTTIANSLHSHDLPWPLDEYTANLEMAPNVAYFAGFNWTRKTVMGLDNRPPTDAELEQMKTLVRQAMEQGAFGLSSGIEYVPAAYASNEEVAELAKVAAQWGGIYVTHMRDEGPKLLESIRDNAEIGRQAKLPVHINHIKSTGVSNHGKSRDALALIDEIHASGVDMTVDIYPYAAFMTYSDLLFPAWSLAGGAEDFRSRIKDPVQRQNIATEMKSIFPQQAGKDFDSIQFEGLPHIEGYAGRTLADYLRDRQQPQTLDAAIDALIDLQYQGRFAAIYHSMAEADIERFLLSPHTMISSDGDLAVSREKHYHPRTYGAFPRVLSTYVRARGVLSLEQAIYKMTGQSAQRLGLQDRGVIQAGNYADLVIFDEQSITDHATFLEPHQYSTGVKHLLINGQLAIQDGRLTTALPGQTLKHQQKH
ncbi:MAG TPA: D-aminoacylase [Porticoccaceae bacterium]|nr:D-aminoacylase [Porticoccaceae bacterium]HIL18258.1 D-aminoacylase [Gammaproteobacteria bacterium]